MAERELELTGDMVPRAVTRTVDQHSQPRTGPIARGAMLSFRGRMQMIWLSNLSPEGAMIGWQERPRIGEGVTLDLDGVRVPAFVRWVRDGRVGLNFTAALPPTLLKQYGI